ncbi:MAG TPA: sensor histidine kinase [Terriglobia bacterium]|nr:sensor histidine kinase [Terriglobia bacterium]
MSPEKNPSQQTRQYHWALLVIEIAVFVGIAIAVSWILGGIRSRLDARLGSALQTVLGTTDKALEIWVEQTEADAAVLASNADLVRNVEKQLQAGREAPVLLSSRALSNIRTLIQPAVELYHLPGFAVIAPDGVQIAGYLDRAIGSRDIAESNPGLLPKVMAGHVALGLPYRSPLFVDSATHREYPVMTVAAPIRNGQGAVIAALALRLDPGRDFTRTTNLARLDLTGETYAFDRNGRMLTQSRFEKELRAAGLIPSNENSILNAEVRDPGGNITEGYRPALGPEQEPLTRMAQSAIAGAGGIDLRGYADYRGVPVVGAWLWDNELGMGLTTEMDVDEALAPYRRVRSLVMFMLLLIAMASAALILILRHRDRLLASNQAYRQAMQAREDMMAVVAHDLKNPINTITMGSYVMLQMTAECGGAQSTNLRRNLEMLQRTAAHMNHLIGDLTDAAKIHAGRFSLERQEYAIHDVIEGVIERTRLLAEAKGIQFSAEVRCHPCPVLVDQARIIQVLDNLLGNAMKFTSAGGRISLEVNASDNEVEVAISDTGSGIPREALNRIFEPYWQVQKTRSGMGLGLFIAKTIVEAHGGRMWVDSTIGRGTTFYFTLPIAVTT